MVKGGFRHLVVIDAGETAGILSVRDIVRCWTDDGATCDVPQSRVAGVGGRSPVKSRHGCRARGQTRSG